ncbi:unnamed protein product [Owenia fusiformis]|uniref:Uncharacterized protein n=1 Tax=Owenia fusiformis TaxID=6347 RepID=A0A8J1Y2D4_OWEFU|nr:unnamed protein product [Owenia fusiformis]
MDKLNIVMNSIIFTQDINNSTKTEDVFGDKLHNFVKQDQGKVIFSGSLAEGIAFMQDEPLDIEINYDGLNRRRTFDMDIMYEDMTYVVLDDIMIGKPKESFRDIGLVPLFFRQKSQENLMIVYINMAVSQKIFFKITNGKMKFDGQKLIEFQKLEPFDFTRSTENLMAVPKNSHYYLAKFLEKLSVIPEKCFCHFEHGHNRYGDLCRCCKNNSDVKFSENDITTRCWTDQRRIHGPAVNEAVFIENNLETNKSKNAHGLYTTLGKASVYIDHVPAISVYLWPVDGLEFFFRKTSSGWPCKKLLQKIVSSGCHVVPRGSLPVPETKFKMYLSMFHRASGCVEWSWSFSVAEKQLVWSLNRTQIRCFLFLKYLYKYSEKCYSVMKDLEYKDALESFHMKCTMFWLCEEVEQSEWMRENEAKCFMKLIDKLLGYLKNGVLPHYFIQEHNVLHDMSAVGREINIKALTSIKESTCAVLCYAFHHRYTDMLYQQWPHLWISLRDNVLKTVLNKSSTICEDRPVRHFFPRGVRFLAY